jgi:pentatricopeptide repeat protein
VLVEDLHIVMRYSGYFKWNMYHNAFQAVNLMKSCSPSPHSAAPSQ